MIKKQIYPKTKRVSNVNKGIYITEKLDGSNLCFFKLNDKLHIAQRNTIFTLTEFEINYPEIKGILYKGLFEWLNTYGKRLEQSLRANAAICGEWISMDKLKYPELLHTFNMFAKANVNKDLELYNIYYDRDLFIYPFENNEFLDFINLVPIVCILDSYPSVKQLDELYELYKPERNVEGFVINNNNVIAKYVRMKNGKIEPHRS